MNWKKILTVLVAVFCFLIVGVIVKAYLDGEFESVETLQIYIKSFGLFAPLILIVIQALQVIIPILPGFLGCAVGAVLFGSAGEDSGVIISGYRWDRSLRFCWQKNTE